MPPPEPTVATTGPTTPGTDPASCRELTIEEKLQKATDLAGELGYLLMTGDELKEKIKASGSGVATLQVPADAGPLVLALRFAHDGVDAQDLKSVKRSRPAIGGGEWVAKTDDAGNVTLSKSVQIKGIDRARSEHETLRGRYVTAKSKSDNARKWADETMAMARQEKPRATLATAQERERQAKVLERETERLEREVRQLVAAHPVLQHDIAVSEHVHAQNRTQKARKQLEAVQAKVDRWAEYEEALEDGKSLDDVQTVQRDSCTAQLEGLQAAVDSCEAAEAAALAKANAVKVQTADSQTIVVKHGEPFLVV